MTGCLSVNVNLHSGSGVDLFRLRTASNGPIKVFVNTIDRLAIRSDFAATAYTPYTSLGTGWHNVELCGTVGANTMWTLYWDGLRVDSYDPDTGTTPIGRIQVGDTAAKTFNANFDDVVWDQSPG